MNKLTKFVFVTLFVLAPIIAKADEQAFDRVMKTKTINCGYIIAPPYLDKDVNTGKMSGINYEMVEAVGRNLGVKINWKLEVGAGDVAAALSANKIDMMCQTMWPSAARYSGMTFTNRPQFYSAIYAVSREDDHRFDGNLSKANNKSIKSVGVDGDFSSDLIKEKLPEAQHLSISGFSGLGDYIMQLTSKKADILFMDKGTIADYSKTSPNKIHAIPGLPPARLYGEHLTVKLGEYKLRDMIDMADLQLIDDGTFTEIVDRYKKEHHTEIYPSRPNILK